MESARSVPSVPSGTSPPEKPVRMIRHSFQVPNLFVDRLLPLLTPPEFIVLIYAARRTLGFGKRQDRISLRQFTSGLRAYDGRELDRGTGLHRGAVAGALKALRRYGILKQVGANDPRTNEGAEYLLVVDESAVDWVGLDWRHASSATAAFRRTQAAKAARASTRVPPVVHDPFMPLKAGKHRESSDEPHPISSDEPHPVSPDEPYPIPLHEPRPVSSDEPHPISSHEPRPVSSHVTTKPRLEIQFGNPDGNQGGGGGAETRGTGPIASGTARWNGCPQAARLLLQDMEISEEVIEELASCPERCYWAIRWSTWWPSVKHRVSNRESFLVKRVTGACRGVEQDQNPPGDWWSHLEKQRREERRRQRIQAKAAEREGASKPAAASTPHDSGQPALPDLSNVPEELRDLWSSFLESQLRSDREAWLQGAAPLRLETDPETGGSLLIVRAETRVAAEWLKRRGAVLVSRAREGDPSFPALRFVAESV